MESVSSGVDFATSALASIAGDAAGNAVVIYTGASSVGATSQVYVRHSTNLGSTWSVPTELGAGVSVNAAFPAIAGAAGGSFHAAFMDTRTGAWNTWYRSSTDGGVTWDPAIRIPMRRRCAVPLPAGFANPYGDYLGIDVMGAGEAVAAWGAAPSWSGPGDIWFNGQT